MAAGAVLILVKFLPCERLTGRSRGFTFLGMLARTIGAPRWSLFEPRRSHPSRSRRQACGRSNSQEEETWRKVGMSPPAASEGR